MCSTQGERRKLFAFFIVKIAINRDYNGYCFAASRL